MAIYSSDGGETSEGLYLDTGHIQGGTCTCSQREHLDIVTVYPLSRRKYM